MIRAPRTLVMAGLGALASTALMVAAPQGRQVPASQQPPPTAPPASQQPATPPTQQPTEISTGFVVGGGAAPKLAVPNFIAGSADLKAPADLIGQVLWDDLRFEREYDLIPRASYSAITPATSFETVNFGQWKELGVDFVVIGAVRQNASSLTVQVRMFDVAMQRSAWAKEYTASASNPRSFAHTIADELHMDTRKLAGVARTKLAFASDRDGEKTRGPIDQRNIKEIYISDYDGENQRRVTVNRSLAINPSWSLDGRAIAYTSYRRGYPDVYVSYIYQGKMDQPAGGTETIHNFLPAFSPDGNRIAFMTNRDGNMEIYTVNRDGSNLRRVTRHQGNDSTPTWSPAGNQIAFTSDRSGRPQIYIVDADGMGQPRRITSETWADRATWSPAPYNEIAYAGQTGPGFDIKIFNLEQGQIRTITDGTGSNESPSWAPNGRHLAFASTRAGRSQIFTIARDGRDLRPVTRSGNNVQPSWSR
ncbi:MAG: PD40 domain-containing protein [Acidobacteria bacterium]|nr:PD40 domain-containing protein [Acidobacteriota bacterium]